MPEFTDTMNIALFSIGGTTVTLGGLLAVNQAVEPSLRLSSILQLMAIGVSREAYKKTIPT